MFRQIINRIVSKLIDADDLARYAAEVEAKDAALDWDIYEERLARGDYDQDWNG